MSKSRVWTDIDFNKMGKQVGNIFLPFQSNKSANGHICTPIAVIKNNEGPTVMLTAGVHGDEYEGQIALRKLLKSTHLGDVSGTIIVLPSLNIAAAIAGTRLSPIDGINLHGAFPGEATSLYPSQELAFYIEHELMPKANYLLDLHSGGTCSEYLPFCSIRLTGIDSLDAKAKELLEVFNAPLSMIWKRKNGRMLSSAAERNGVVALGGEFGGGGTVSAGGVKIIEDGISNVLSYLSVLPSKIEPPQIKTQFVEASDQSYFVYSKIAGIFEPSVQIGEEVAAGQECGKIYPVQQIENPPVTHYFQKAGLVISKRHPALIEMGDCIATLATTSLDVK